MREAIEIFRHGQTVRYFGPGTPSQKSVLWVVDLSGYAGREDHGYNVFKINRQSDEDCIIYINRAWITAATVLDLIATS